MMKHAKKLASLLLVIVMVLSLGVTAFAEDTTGSITIEPSKGQGAVSVEDKTFNAYKILDLKMVGTNGYVYTVPEDLKEFYSTCFTDDDGNTITLDPNAADFDTRVRDEINKMGDNSEELFAFAQAALQAANDAEIQPVASAKDESNAKISNLPYGYYVVEDEGTAKPISALMLDSVNADITITLKADQPSIDKEIDGDNDTDGATEGDTKYNNVDVGDAVPYQLTTRVPDMTGYTKYYFVLTDTLSKGLTYDQTTGVTITMTKNVDGEETVNKTLKEDTDFTVTCTENKGEDNTTLNTTLKIVFKDFIKYNTDDYKDAQIHISYSAIVNKDAVIGAEGNSNKVVLTYSNNPNTDESGTPGDEPGPKSPTGVTPESETRTYVTGVTLIKTNSAKEILTGAQFEITGEKTNIVLVTGEIFTVADNGTYWKLKDGTYTTTDPATEGIDENLYESTTVKYIKEDAAKTPVTTTETVKATGFVGEEGTISFEGLSAGTYTIRELKAPDGYNLLKDPINVTISFTAPADDATSANCTWEYAWKQGTNDLTAVENAANTIRVVNLTGSELPSTGGIGTTIFYIAGSILLVGAAVLLIAKKRMNSVK